MSSKLAASFSFSNVDWCIFMAGRWQKTLLNYPGLQLSILNEVKVIKEMMREKPCHLFTSHHPTFSCTFYLLEHISEVWEVRMVGSGEPGKRIGDQLWNVFHVRWMPGKHPVSVAPAENQQWVLIFLFVYKFRHLILVHSILWQVSAYLLISNKKHSRRLLH